MTTDPNCVFCKIASNQASAEIVFDEDQVMAFLDIHPIVPGHTLVIPKEHYANLLELPDELWTEIGRVSRRVALALRGALSSQGFNIGMNNFEAAGQEVFHAHIHVIPRYFNDGLKLFPQQSYKPGDMEKTAAQLRQAL